MGMVKVQPDEGCDNKEEVDRRRGWLKLMTPHKMLIVESEVQDLWKSNRDTQSSAMQELLPVEPPHNFW